MTRAKPLTGPQTHVTTGALNRPGFGTYLGLGILALFAIFPVLYVLLLSLQTAREASSLPPTLLPASPQISNFGAIAERIPLVKLFFNSLVYSSSTTLLLVIISTMAAYALVKLKIPGHQLLTSLFVASILFPPEVRAIPLYTMIASWNWVDTWAGLVLPLVATGFGLFFMRQFMLTIPDSVLEAARMDGAGEIQVFLRMVMPMSVPGMATLTLFNFVFRWNDYMWPLVVTRSQWTTLPLGVLVFKTSENLVPWNLVAAAAVITLTPVLVLFVALRRQIMDGVALQAGK